MEFRQLRYFVAIVENGSFTRAAEALFIAQPSLSQQIALLEDELHVRLLIRGGRGISLTPSGTVFYSQANVLLKQLSTMRELVQMSDDSPSGVVSVGFPFSISSLLAVPVVEAVSSSYPNIQLSVVESPSVYLSELFLNGRLDLCFLSKKLPRSNTVHAAYDEELRFAGTPSAMAFLGESKEIELVKACGHPLLLPSRSNTSRSSIENAIAQFGLHLNVVAELESSRLLQAAAIKNLGFIIQPASALDYEVRAGHLRAVNIVEPSLTRTVSLCSSSHRPMTRQTQCVLDILLKIASNYWA